MGLPPGAAADGKKPGKPQPGWSEEPKSPVHRAAAAVADAVADEVKARPPARCGRRSARLANASPSLSRSLSPNICGKRCSLRRPRVCPSPQCGGARR